MRSKSAELFRTEAKPYLTGEDISFAVDIILGTKRHELIGEWSKEKLADMALFLDIDLSILGASEAIFDTYEDNVRKEFSFVPEPIFCSARAGILKAFMNRDRIYYTDACSEAWERKARNNLESSIAKLEGTAP